MKQWIQNLRTVSMLFIIGFNGLIARAQGSEKDAVDMADTMRTSGKIYVVVIIVALVFGGLLLYTILIDRKVTKLEKEMRDHEEKSAQNF